VISTVPRPDDFPVWRCLRHFRPRAVDRSRPRLIADEETAKGRDRGEQVFMVLSFPQLVDEVKSARVASACFDIHQAFVEGVSSRQCVANGRRAKPLNRARRLRTGSPSTCSRGNRANSRCIAIRPSRRATVRPAQVCTPPPKARCSFGMRATSNLSGQANC